MVERVRGYLILFYFLLLSEFIAIYGKLWYILFHLFR